MKKRILSLLMALALCLSLLPTMAWATETHTNHNDIATAWEDSTKLPDAAGNWYLNTNVTLSETWNVPAGTSDEDVKITNLCLNGHVIKLDDGKTGSVIKVPQYATLNLYDCGSTPHYFEVDTDGLWKLTDETNDTETVTGGVITGGTGEVNGEVKYGGGVYVAGTFNMNGGNIVGNKTTKADGSAGGCGAGVYVNTGASFTMTGDSVISGNTCNNGAGVNSTGTFTMSGNSKIAYNKGGCGGGVLSDGSFTMSGNSIIEYNEGTMWGGGVEVTNSGTFAMSGNSRITNNNGGIQGGGVYVSNGTFTMNGGSIVGNAANAFKGGSGGGVYVASPGTFNMNTLSRTASASPTSRAAKQS